MNIILPYRRLIRPSRRLLGIDWSNPLTRGLVACVPFHDGAGRPVELVRRVEGTGNTRYTTGPYGNALAAANGVASANTNFGDLPVYDTPTDLTAAMLLNVITWSTATSGDFPWGKDAFQTRGWSLLNNGTFGDQVGFRTSDAGASYLASVTRATVGTGLMLFVGRRSGDNAEFLTVKSSGLTSHASVGAFMVSPAGSVLNTGSTSANGNVQVLCCWLWDHPRSNDTLRELFNYPWQIFIQRPQPTGKSFAAGGGAGAYHDVFFRGLHQGFAQGLR